MIVETTATSPNQNARPNGVRPSSITIHHWGKDGQSFAAVRDYLCRPGGTSSAHYVAQDGRVACIVDPDRRAWHAGTSRGNDVSIGIECRPEATEGDYATVAQLVADLRAVYGPLPLVPHSSWKATACPGRWDLARLDRLATALAPTAPTAARTTRRKVQSMPVIYRAGGYPALGVLAHNGGFVTLKSQEEVDNLRKAGAPVIWVEKVTLDNLIADVRA